MPPVRVWLSATSRQWYYGVVVSTEKSSAKDEVRFNVRVSPSLHRRLVDRAIVNKRSMNSEVVALLDQGLSATGDLSVAMLVDEVRRVQGEIDATARQLNLLADRRNRLRDALSLATGNASIEGD